MASIYGIMRYELWELIQMQMTEGQGHLVQQISPEMMSANLDQDKTGRSMDPTYVSIQSAEALGIFSLGNKHNLPYIATVHCYASTKESITCP